MHRTKTKAFQMGRSILPSKRGRSAKRAKDTLHRNNRRYNNDQLHVFRGSYSDVCEDYEDTEEDLVRWIEPHRAGLWGGDIVQERRDADKIGHMIRWAKKVTANIREEDRLSKMSSLLPVGVIGDHAMTHLGDLDYRDNFLYRYNNAEYQARLARQAEEVRDFHAELRAAVTAIAHNKVKRDRMNAYVAKRWVEMRATYIRQATSPRPMMVCGKYVYVTPEVPETTPFDVPPQMNGYHRLEYFLAHFRLSRSHKYKWLYWSRNDWVIGVICEYFRINNPLLR